MWIIDQISFTEFGGELGDQQIGEGHTTKD